MINIEAIVALIPVFNCAIIILSTVDGPNQHPVNDGNNAKYDVLPSANVYMALRGLLLIPIFGLNVFEFVEFFQNCYNEGGSYMGALYSAKIRFNFSIKYLLVIFECISLLAYILELFYFVLFSTILRNHWDSTTRPDQLWFTSFATLITICDGLQMLLLSRTYATLRKIKDVRLVENAVRSSLPMLFFPWSLFLISSFLCGSVLLFIEPCYNTEMCMWMDLFDSFFYAVSSMATVGYGNQVPLTFSGRMLSVVMMLFGALFLALPMAIIRSGKAQTDGDTQIRGSVDDDVGDRCVYDSPMRRYISNGLKTPWKNQIMGFRAMEKVVLSNCDCISELEKYYEGLFRFHWTLSLLLNVLEMKHVDPGISALLLKEVESSQNQVLLHGKANNFQCYIGKNDTSGLLTCLPLEVANTVRPLDHRLYSQPITALQSVIMRQQVSNDLMFVRSMCSRIFRWITRVNMPLIRRNLLKMINITNKLHNSRVFIKCNSIKYTQNFDEFDYSGSSKSLLSASMFTAHLRARLTLVDVYLLYQWRCRHVNEHKNKNECSSFCPYCNLQVESGNDQVHAVRTWTVNPFAGNVYNPVNVLSQNTNEYRSARENDIEISLNDIDGYGDIELSSVNSNSSIDDPMSPPMLSDSTHTAENRFVVWGRKFIMGTILVSIVLFVLSSIPYYFDSGESSDMCLLVVKAYCSEIRGNSHKYPDNPGCFVVKMNQTNSNLYVSGDWLDFDCDSENCFRNGYNFGTEYFTCANGLTTSVSQGKGILPFESQNQLKDETIFMSSAGLQAHYGVCTRMECQNCVHTVDDIGYIGNNRLLSSAETSQRKKKQSGILRRMEILITIIFFVEFLIRGCSKSLSYSHTKSISLSIGHVGSWLNYVRTMTGAIDLIAFMPLFIECLFVVGTVDGAERRVLQTVSIVPSLPLPLFFHLTQFLRSIRVLKFCRFASDRLRDVYSAFTACVIRIALYFVLLVLFVVPFAYLIYISERGFPCYYGLGLCESVKIDGAGSMCMASDSLFPDVLWEGELLQLNALNHKYSESTPQAILHNGGMVSLMPNALYSLWFSLVTVTSVGFGDIYVLTYSGQIITILVILLGTVYTAIPLNILIESYIGAANSISEGKLASEGCELYRCPDEVYIKLEKYRTFLFLFLGSVDSYGEMILKLKDSNLSRGIGNSSRNLIEKYVSFKELLNSEESENNV